MSWARGSRLAYRLTVNSLSQTLESSRSLSGNSETVRGELSSLSANIEWIILSWKPNFNRAFESTATRHRRRKYSNQLLSKNFSRKVMHIIFWHSLFYDHHVLYHTTVTSSYYCNIMMLNLHYIRMKRPDNVKIGWILHLVTVRQLTLRDWCKKNFERTECQPASTIRILPTLPTSYIATLDSSSQL